MVAHACDPALGKWRLEDQDHLQLHIEFKASLGKKQNRQELQRDVFHGVLMESGLYKSCYTGGCNSQSLLSSGERSVLGNWTVETMADFWQSLLSSLVRPPPP